MHANIEIWDDDYVLDVAEVWDGTLNVIPTNKLKDFFGEAYLRVAMEGKTSLITSLHVFREFEDWRRNQSWQEQ